MIAIGTATRLANTAATLRIDIERLRVYGQKMDADEAAVRSRRFGAGTLDSLPPPSKSGGIAALIHRLEGAAQVYDVLWAAASQAAEGR